MSDDVIIAGMVIGFNLVLVTMFFVFIVLHLDE